MACGRTIVGHASLFTVVWTRTRGAVLNNLKSIGEACVWWHKYHLELEKREIKDAQQMRLFPHNRKYPDVDRKPYHFGQNIAIGRGRK